MQPVGFPFYEQGGVGKLAALLHAPRAARRTFSYSIIQVFRLSFLFFYVFETVLALSFLLQKYIRPPCVLVCAFVSAVTYLTVLFSYSSCNIMTVIFFLLPLLSLSCIWDICILALLHLFPVIVFVNLTMVLAYHVFPCIAMLYTAPYKLLYFLWLHTINAADENAAKRTIMTLIPG